MKVYCPNCKKESSFASENKFRPFCSERCKLIDLGAWASDSYKIASIDPVSENDENLDNLEHNDKNES
jgi:endogenous inhibitor of DNA gyrase (YacG/DUF329 family)